MEEVYAFSIRRYEGVSNDPRVFHEHIWGDLMLRYPVLFTGDWEEMYDLSYTVCGTYASGNIDLRVYLMVRGKEQAALVKTFLR